MSSKADKKIDLTASNKKRNNKIKTISENIVLVPKGIRIGYYLKYLMFVKKDPSQQLG